jgi:glycogen debranching enzyme
VLTNPTTGPVAGEAALLRLPRQSLHQHSWPAQLLPSFSSLSLAHLLGDALASNMGHCLWTGIVDVDKAPAVAARLMSPEMFSGWGVRTLATSMSAYNPMSYHNGSVWPHDNAPVAAGLMRYGSVEEARRVATAVLDAAAAFGHTLPELFAGFPREEYDPPLPYPAACSPQAWAAATPVQLLRTLLRLDPSVPERVVHFAPAWPAEYGPLAVRNLRLAERLTSLTVHGARSRLTGLGPDVSVVRAPRAPISPLCAPPGCRRRSHPARPATDRRATRAYTAS